MSEAATPTTRLQGCIYVGSAVTIRVTEDPAGVPVTSDFAITAGTLYQSHDALCTAWTTQMVTDLGAGWSAAVGGLTAAGLGYTTITGTANMSVDWSFAGSGTTIRNYLGFTGNIANQTSPQTSSSHTVPAYYPSAAAQVLTRTGTTRPRAQMLTLSAASRTQHNTSPSDADDAELDVELRFGTTTPHAAQNNFILYFLTSLETYSSESQFTILHGGVSHFVTFAGDELKFRFERVSANWDDLWRCRFPVRVVGSSV